MKRFEDDTEKKLYQIWIDMKRRCYNPKRDYYKYYGGKGIRISDEWLNFSKFYADMKSGYRKGLTVDRIDTNKDYSNDNCRWATMSEQNNNKTNNLIFSVDGITASLAVLCRKYGIRHCTALYRIRSGWDIEKALRTKPNHHNKYIGGEVIT